MQGLIFTLAFLFVSVYAQEQVGYYWWTWQANGNAPSGTNIGVAFSGWVNPTSAISDSAAVINRLPGRKYISLGGGNANGAWTASALTAVTDAITSNKFTGYQGICYDIEQGDAGLSSHFTSSFTAAKSHGLSVLVTISHSAPYGFSDAYTLMQTFIGDSSIDYLSPQLYTSGNEGSNDYTTSGGVAWTMYRTSHARVIPSIVRASLYSSARTYFSGQGVNITGFIQWAQG